MNKYYLFLVVSLLFFYMAYAYNNGGFSEEKIIDSRSIVGVDSIAGVDSIVDDTVFIENQSFNEVHEEKENSLNGYDRLEYIKNFVWSKDVKTDYLDELVKELLEEDEAGSVMSFWDIAINTNNYNLYSYLLNIINDKIDLVYDKILDDFSYGNISENKLIDISQIILPYSKIGYDQRIISMAEEIRDNPYYSGVDVWVDILHNQYVISGYSSDDFFSEFLVSLSGKNKETILLKWSDNSIETGDVDGYYSNIKGADVVSEELLHRSIANIDSYITNGNDYSNAYIDLMLELRKGVSESDLNGYYEWVNVYKKIDSDGIATEIENNIENFAKVGLLIDEILSEEEVRKIDKIQYIKKNFEDVYYNSNDFEEKNFASNVLNKIESSLGSNFLYEEMYTEDEIRKIKGGG